MRFVARLAADKRTASTNKHSNVPADRIAASEGGGVATTTMTPIRPGQHVVLQDNEYPCPGTYQPNGAPGRDTLLLDGTDPRPLRAGRPLHVRRPTNALAQPHTAEHETFPITKREPPWPDRFWPLRTSASDLQLSGAAARAWVLRGRQCGSRRTRPRRAPSAGIDGIQAGDRREPGRGLLRPVRAEEARVLGRAFRAQTETVGAGAKMPVR